MATRKHYKRSGRRSRRVTGGGFWEFIKSTMKPKAEADAKPNTTTGTEADAQTTGANTTGAQTNENSLVAKSDVPATPTATEPKVSWWDTVFGQKKPTAPPAQSGGRRKRRRTQRNRSAK